MNLYCRSIFLAALLFSEFTGVAQKRSAAYRDKPLKIIRSEFDKLIDTSIVLLKNKRLSEISDSEHIKIMMCLNTMFLAHDHYSGKPIYKGGRYDRLVDIIREKDYTGGITRVYQYSYNRGMGYYFPKLDMELYGTPHLYACFSVEEDFIPRQNAEELFNKYKQVIEWKKEVIVDNTTPVFGDINGDGKEDCIISYVMTSKAGGNAIVGHDAAIYVNTGTSMKMTGSFPSFDFCYTLHHIKNQVIYATEYKCQPPYDTVSRERKFRYIEGEIKLIN